MQLTTNQATQLAVAASVSNKSSYMERERHQQKIEVAGFEYKKAQFYEKADRFVYATSEQHVWAAAKATQANGVLCRTTRSAIVTRRIGELSLPVSMAQSAVVLIGDYVPKPSHDEATRTACRR